MSDENCCGACGYPIHATKDKACDWCRQTADRIEALTAKVKLMDDLDVINGEKIEALTAKLAQATWLLTEAAVQLEEGKIKTRRNRAAIIWNLLDEMKAEIEGEKGCETNSPAPV
jgi:hypothetical protein